MKTKLFLTSVLVVLCATFAVAQTTLQLNLQKGETYYQTSKSTSEVAQSVSGMSMNTTVIMDTKYSYKVVDVTGDNYELEVKFDRLVMDTKTPQISLSVSSEEPGKDAASSLLSAMKNGSFTVKMNKSGEVSEVQGLEELINTALEQSTGISQAQKQMAKGQISQLLGADQLKGNIELASAVYPKTKVSKGDSWENITQINSGAIVDIRTKYTLVESDGNSNKISGTSTIASPSGAKPVSMEGMSMEYNLSGTGAVEMTLDAKSGWIIEAAVKQNIKGDIKVLDGMAAGMTIPISTNNTTIISNK